MLLIITVYTKLLVCNTYCKLAVSIQYHGADAVQLPVVAVALGGSWKSRWSGLRVFEWSKNRCGLVFLLLLSNAWYFCYHRSPAPARGGLLYSQYCLFCFMFCQSSFLCIWEYVLHIYSLLCFSCPFVWQLLLCGFLLHATISISVCPFGNYISHIIFKEI